MTPSLVQVTITAIFLSVAGDLCPILPLIWTGSSGLSQRLPPVLLRWNPELRLTRLALDEDGDINLLADLPVAHSSSSLFAETLQLLACCTDRLASELRGLVAEPLD